MERGSTKNDVCSVPPPTSRTGKEELGSPVLWSVGCKSSEVHREITQLITKQALLARLLPRLADEYVAGDGVGYPYRECNADHPAIAVLLSQDAFIGENDGGKGRNDVAFRQVRECASHNPGLGQPRSASRAPRTSARVWTFSFRAPSRVNAWT